MVVYEVKASVAEEFREPFERYMAGTHVPDVMKTGCFESASFETISDGTYRTQYRAASRQDLDRYFTEHAPALRKDLADHFPDGIDLSREEWTVIRQFA